jgi:hypothetical protein
MDQGFWFAWAKRHAAHAYRIHNNPAQVAPPVVDVSVDTGRGLFVVVFEDGKVFEVEVSGIGRTQIRTSSQSS